MSVTNDNETLEDQWNKEPKAREKLRDGGNHTRIFFLENSLHQRLLRKRDEKQIFDGRKATDNQNTNKADSATFHKRHGKSTIPPPKKKIFLNK